jgi:hypothetical protein
MQALRSEFDNPILVPGYACGFHCALSGLSGWVLANTTHLNQNKNGSHLYLRKPKFLVCTLFDCGKMDESSNEEKKTNPAS